MNLKAGEFVKIKVENVMYPYRDRYANYMHIPEFHFFEGNVVYEKWFRTNEIGLTTNQKHFPMRVIQKERIVEVNGEESKFVSQSLQAEQDSERRRITIKGSKGTLYQVEVGGKERPRCSCPGYQFRSHCRHITEATAEAA